MNINKVALKYWKSDSQKYICPFTKQQISEIEKLVSKKIPDDLIQFMTKFAGIDFGIGTIDDPVAFFVVKVSNGTKFFAGVETEEYVMGISYFSTFEDMVKIYKTLTNDSLHYEAGARIPKYMLPIDADGTLFINLSEENYGEIRLWEPIEESWGNEYNNTMDFVAKNFTDFINSITTMEEAEKNLAQNSDTENSFVGSEAWKNYMKQITGSDDPNVWEKFIDKT